MMDKKLLHVGLGLAVGLLTGKLLQTKKVREFAVGAVAGGLKAKESLDKTVEKLREGSEDILADAKVKKEVDQKKQEEKAAKKEAEKDIQKVCEEAKEDIDEAVEKAESEAKDEK